MVRDDNDLKNIQQLVAAEEDPKLFAYMENHIERFFSSENLSEMYQTLRSVKIETSESPIPRLILAWLAFVCGDNLAVTSILKVLQKTNFNNAQEYSLYCSLRAISGGNLSREERESYACLSIDVLPKTDKSFYMANASLTYGQMLSSQDKYRQAALTFATAYDLFDYNQMQFPAVVARVNELLNRSKLGEFHTVIDICQNLLRMTAQFDTEKENIWDILHLPLGICYYELNKPHLAVNHLQQAKQSIERLKLFHMHGLIEIYLFKAFYSLHDRIRMEKIYLEASVIYKPMHDRMGQIILSSFYLFLNPAITDAQTQYNIQQLEMIYETDRENTPALAIQVLVDLKSKGLSALISRQTIHDHLKKLRDIGNIPELQLFLVLTANLHFSEGNEGRAIACLQEALGMYKEFGLSASFYFLSPPMLNSLKKLDGKLWQVFTAENDEANRGEERQLLSQREKEIMRLIARGKTNQEVGDLLFIGVGTVKWHINHIFSKLQVNNRVQAIEKARAMGEI